MNHIKEALNLDNQEHLVDYIIWDLLVILILSFKLIFLIKTFIKQYLIGVPLMIRVI